jgi:hypothetical protein
LFSGVIQPNTQPNTNLNTKYEDLISGIQTITTHLSQYLSRVNHRIQYKQYFNGWDVNNPKNLYSNLVIDSTTSKIYLNKKYLSIVEDIKTFCISIGINIKPINKILSIDDIDENKVVTWHNNKKLAKKYP